MTRDSPVIDGARSWPHLSFAEALARLADRLAGAAPVRLSLDGFRTAAVAVVLLDIDGQAHVILTRRSPTLRAYSGQVSLPGGMCDDCDHTAAATAAREAHEEIGLEPERLRVLGQLDDQATRSGIIITPVIAAVHARPVYQPNHDEVACVFEAPLALFADPTRAEPRGERRVAHLTYPLRAYHYGDHVITGATAHILELVSALAMD